MEFYCYSPSEMFVVQTANQFVGHDDGLLQQQRQDSHVCQKTRIFPLIFINYWDTTCPIVVQCSYFIGCRLARLARLI